MFSNLSVQNKNRKLVRLPLLGFVFLALLFQPNVSHAQESVDPSGTAPSATTAVIDEVTYPYTKTFIISAYYSPLLGQNKYVTGSYDGDVRLNGEGVHSADGSLVYPGMIAAPKSYPFGTKMNIPGIGIVAVHDRGGAIVHAGERNQAYDRLDVWMGYGDTGLARALRWGRRTVEVTVYGIDDTLKEEVYLEGYSEAEKYVQSSLASEPSPFAEDLSYGNQGENVAKLQESLKKLDYYHGSITQIYDSSTQDSVIGFQMDSEIIDDALDFGAGYFGPQSRQALASALQQFEEELQKNLPKANLGRDDAGDEVKKLQEALRKLGYDVNINGVYDDKTVNAIFEFQKTNEILESEDQFGAGYFGPRTLEILASKLTIDTVNAQSETIPVEMAFAKDLALGDKHDDVFKLQEELTRLHFLAVETSGYFGEVTEHAVFKFQQSQGLIRGENDPGAGLVGPSTRARLNSIIAERELLMDKRRDSRPLR